MSTVWSPFFITRCTISFPWPFGGIFRSSTVPVILISLVASYLGAACAMVRAFNSSTAQIGPKHQQIRGTVTERRMVLLLGSGERSEALSEERAEPNTPLCLRESYSRAAWKNQEIRCGLSG